MNLQDIFSNDRYLIEDMTRLPGVTFLSLLMMANGHSFGATLFHVLRMCTGVRKLALEYLEVKLSLIFLCNTLWFL